MTIVDFNISKTEFMLVTTRQKRAFIDELSININSKQISQVKSAKTLGLHQGGRKEGRGNEPIGSCAMCDARSTGSRALEGKNR